MKVSSCLKEALKITLWSSSSFTEFLLFPIKKNYFLLFVKNEKDKN